MKLLIVDYLGVTAKKDRWRGIEEIKEGCVLFLSGADVTKGKQEDVWLMVRSDQIRNIIKKKYVNEKLLLIE